MKQLKFWMRIVGGFFIILGIFNSPPVVAARFVYQYPLLGIGHSDLAAKVISDLWFLFGVETAVIGLMLIVGSNYPLRSKMLIQTVLLLELTRGILVDAYWISRGYYSVVFYAVWIIIHLVIIVTGWRALQEAQAHSSEQKVQPSLQESL